MQDKRNSIKYKSTIVPDDMRKNMLMKRWGLCCNVTPSDHAHILHTGVLEVEEFNEKGSRCGSLTVLEIIAVKMSNFP